MVDKRISELTAYTTPVSADVLPIVHTAGMETKKITYEDLMDNPHGSFSSNADQTCTGGTTADAIIYQDTEDSNQVTLSLNSHINIAVAGTYLVMFSAIARTTVPNSLIEIWLAVDGTNVPRSNTISRFIGTGNERVIAVQFIYTFTAGQYFQLFMWSDSNTTKLEATGTQVNPTRPACPGIIVTVNRVGT